MKKLVCLTWLVLFSYGLAFGQIILYDNQAPGNWNDAYPTAVNSATDEIGDEINLASGTPRTIDTLSIQCFGQNLSGDEQVEVRIYAADGPKNDQGAVTPGTVIYDSAVDAGHNFSLTQLNGRSILTVANINKTVPDTLIWTVRFTGVTTGESAGLAVHGPPAVGTSFNDYWENTGSGWELYQFNNPPLPGSFGAELTAVPEPSQYALLMSGGVLVFTMWRRCPRFGRSLGLRNA